MKLANNLMRPQKARWLVGHEVSSEQFQRLYGVSETFYDLPVEEKRRYTAHAGGDVRGYTGLFEESNDPNAMGDRKECYGYSPRSSG